MYANRYHIGMYDLDKYFYSERSQQSSPLSSNGKERRNRSTSYDFPRTKFTTTRISTTNQRFGMSYRIQRTRKRQVKTKGMISYPHRSSDLEGKQDRQRKR